MHAISYLQGQIFKCFLYKKRLFRLFYKVVKLPSTTNGAVNLGTKNNSELEVKVEALNYAQ